MSEQERKTETPISLTISIDPDNPDLCGDCPNLLPDYQLRHIIDKRACRLFSAVGDNHDRFFTRFYEPLITDNDGTHRNIFCKAAETRYRVRMEEAIYARKQMEKRDSETKKVGAIEYKGVAGWSKTS